MPSLLFLRRRRADGSGSCQLCCFCCLCCHRRRKTIPAAFVCARRSRASMDGPRGLPSDPRRHSMPTLAASPAQPDVAAGLELARSALRPATPRRAQPCTTNNARLGHARLLRTTTGGGHVGTTRTPHQRRRLFASKTSGSSYSRIFRMCQRLSKRTRKGVYHSRTDRRREGRTVKLLLLDVDATTVIHGHGILPAEKRIYTWRRAVGVARGELSESQRGYQCV